MPFEPPTAVDLDVFPWSIAVGDPTPESVVVIVRANAPSVELVLARASEEGWSEAARLPGRDTEATPARVEISGLDPDTAYVAYAEVDGVRSAVTPFRTAPAVGAWRQVRLVATSCLGGSNPGMPNLSFIREHDPDAVLLLGDTIYADGSVSREDYAWIWDFHNAKPEMRTLWASGAVVATWDDHEVSNNWTLSEVQDPLADTVTEEQRDIATAVWRETVPMSQGLGGFGVWRTVSMGDLVDLFVLDCRGERAEGQIISPEQEAWIVGALAESTAHFKIVLSSVHLTDHTELIGIVEAEDRWQGYPESRAALVSAMEATPHCFCITGDMHYGAVQRLDVEGDPGHGLYEVAAGPGGSRIFPLADVAAVGGGEVPAHYETVVQDWSFCVVDLDPGLSTVNVRFVGDDGSVLAEQSFDV